MELICPSSNGQRPILSPAKRPLLKAIARVVGGLRDYWPLSVRQVHYRLLGDDAPLLHADKAQRYANDVSSYRACIDVCARARVADLLPWEYLDDETRPTELNAAFASLPEFVEQEARNVLRGYWRDRMAGQDCHVEIVAEKLTVQSIISPVARHYTMPLTITRGMCCLPAKRAIFERFNSSRQAALVLLIVSDLDPAGEAIAQDLVSSLRRDFGVENVLGYKAALTIDQVRQFNLTPSMDAKLTSPTFREFLRRYGPHAYELEALSPSDLTALLESAVEEVIDLDAFTDACKAERADMARLGTMRERATKFFARLID
jgi:hypothetical protein